MKRSSSLNPRAEHGKPWHRARAGLGLVGLVASILLAGGADEPPAIASAPAPAAPIAPATTDDPATLANRLAVMGAQIAAATGIQLVPISGGPFIMGDQGRFPPMHPVTMLHPFLMGATDVTQAQWTAVMGNNPSKFKGDERPVESVAWTEAMAFCARLTKQEREAGRLPAGFGFTLPTESEWEYACRAGGAEKPGGLPDDTMWYAENSGSQTQPVGQKQPNSWGLYDMLGNVKQWCRNVYGSLALTDEFEVRDMLAKDSGTRAFRGGSWMNNLNPIGIREDPDSHIPTGVMKAGGGLADPATNGGAAGELRSSEIGFRVVLTVGIGEENEYRDRAAALYQQVIGSSDAGAEFSELVADAGSPDRWRRLYAVNYLGQLCRDQSPTDQVGNQSPADQARIRPLSEKGRAQIMAVLGQALGDPDHAITLDAIIWIGEIGQEYDDAAALAAHNAAVPGTVNFAKARQADDYNWYAAAVPGLVKLVEARQEKDTNWYAAAVLAKVRGPENIAKALPALLHAAVQPGSGPPANGFMDLRNAAAGGLLDLIASNQLKAKAELTELKTHSWSPALTGQLEALLRRM